MRSEERIVEPFFKFPDELIGIIENLCVSESGQKNGGDFIKKFSPEIKRLSDFYNRRSPLPPTGRTGRFSHNPLAYIAYFLPSNFFKIAFLLLDLFSLTGPGNGISNPKRENEDFPFTGRNLRVLDLGAGPGTNGLGFLDFCARYPVPYFKNSRIECLAADQDARLLNYASLLFKEYEQALKPALAERNLTFHFQVLQRKFRSTPAEFEGPFHFIFIGNLLNEMVSGGHSFKAIAEWLGGLMGHLTPDGFLLVFEPALRKTSRDLLTIRNLLASEKRASIVAPCLHQGPCPIMAPGGSEKDWCHQEKEWSPPPWILQTDNRIGNRKEALKYAYLVLSPGGWEPSLDSGHWRAVSEILPSKGKKEVFLCNAAGRLRFYRLNKEESPLNHPFSEIKRGNLLNIRGPQPFPSSRIGTDWEVKIKV